MAEARTLVLVRHGETDWNRSGRAQGHADVSLNATGHAQARAVARALAAYRPVRLWSSDLMRAAQTAEHVAAATGLRIEQDPRLREYDVGERSGLSLRAFAEVFPEAFASWLEDSGRTLVPGEETTAEVCERVVPALRGCLDSLEPGQTGVVVFHGGCLKVGLCGVLGWPWEVARTLSGLENGGFCVLAEHEVRGGLRLTSYNERAVGLPHGPDFATDGPVG